MPSKHIGMAKSRVRGDSSYGLPGQAQELRGRLLRDSSLMLDIKVIPRAHAAEVSELMANGVLKVKVTAIPEKGRANDEVCAVLAGYLDVPKRNVQVILGHGSREKRVRVVLR